MSAYDGNCSNCNLSDCPGAPRFKGICSRAVHPKSTLISEMLKQVDLSDLFEAVAVCMRNGNVSKTEYSLRSGEILEVALHKQADIERETHITHCCEKHGCKYSNTAENCPVVKGKAASTGGCEYCDIEELEGKNSYSDNDIAEAIHHLPKPVWQTYVTRCGGEWAAVFAVGTQFFTIAQGDEMERASWFKNQFDNALHKVVEQAFKAGQLESKK